MHTAKYYKTNLRKPSWAPPASLFGPVWTFLYVLIAISYAFVAYAYFSLDVPFIVLLPFILNLIFNLIYVPIQFGLKSNVLASIDVLLVFATLVWAIVVIFPFAPLVTILNIPYLLWTAFACVLQITITFLNR